MIERVSGRPVAEGGVQVVWPPAQDDFGNNRYPGIAALLDREEEDPARERGRHVFQTMHGLHVGHTWMGVKGRFRPGQDVVVPNEEYALDPARGKRACQFFHHASSSGASSPEGGNGGGGNDGGDGGGGGGGRREGGAERSVKLLFLGTLVQSAHRDNVRIAVFETLAPLVANRTDYVIGKASFIAGGRGSMSDAVFCLSVHGQDGGSAQRDYMGLMEGCLPVQALSHTSFIYEELYPPKSYGLVVEEDRMHLLPEMMDTFSPRQLRQLRHKASEVCRGFLPPEGAAGFVSYRPVGASDRPWDIGGDGDGPGKIRGAGEVPLDADGNSFSSLWRVLEKRKRKRSG